MRTGDLKNKITFEAKRRVPDGMSGFTSTWEAVISDVWASIWPIKAAEQNNANVQAGVATLRVRVRFRRIIKADWRIKWGSRYLSICSEPIDVGMEHRFLELLCKEIK